MELRGVRDKRFFRRWVTLSFAVVAFVGLGGVEGSWGQDDNKRKPGKQVLHEFKNNDCYGVPTTFSYGTGNAVNASLNIPGYNGSYELDQSLAPLTTIQICCANGVQLKANIDDQGGGQWFLSNGTGNSVNCTMKLNFTGSAIDNSESSTSLGLNPSAGQVSVSIETGVSTEYQKSSETPRFFMENLAKSGRLQGAAFSVGANDWLVLEHIFEQKSGKSTVEKTLQIQASDASKLMAHFNKLQQRGSKKDRSALSPETNINECNPDGYLTHESRINRQKMYVYILTAIVTKEIQAETQAQLIRSAAIAGGGSAVPLGTSGGPPPEVPQKEIAERKSEMGEILRKAIKDLKVMQDG